MQIIGGEAILVHEGLQPSPLVIIDLFSPGVNAAAKVTQYHEIRGLFKYTHHYLLEMLKRTGVENKGTKIL